ncbi:MAG: sigma-70 family RNA polymerase sigma factor [Candidatus Omnitrophica bacterium]|nr:sigma-70 family RNA polymerase sigma factor [Candidatus Omnitrophota bacterium]
MFLSIYDYSDEIEHEEFSLRDEIDYKRLMQYIKNLPAKERMAFLAINKLHPEKKSCRALSKEWGCSPQTVCNKAKKAQGKIKKFLGV